MNHHLVVCPIKSYSRRANKGVYMHNSILYWSVLMFRSKALIMGSGPFLRSFLVFSISCSKLIYVIFCASYLIDACHIALDNFQLSPMCGNISTQVGSNVPFFWSYFGLVDRMKQKKYDRIFLFEYPPYIIPLHILLCQFMYPCLHVGL